MALQDIHAMAVEAHVIVQSAAEVLGRLSTSLGPSTKLLGTWLQERDLLYAQLRQLEQQVEASKRDSSKLVLQDVVLKNQKEHVRELEAQVHQLQASLESVRHERQAEQQQLEAQRTQLQQTRRRLMHQQQKLEQHWRQFQQQSGERSGHGKAENHTQLRPVEGTRKCALGDAGQAPELPSPGSDSDMSLPPSQPQLRVDRIPETLVSWPDEVTTPIGLGPPAVEPQGRDPHGVTAASPAARLRSAAGPGGEEQPQCLSGGADAWAAAAAQAAWASRELELTQDFAGQLQALWAENHALQEDLRSALSYRRTTQELRASNQALQQQLDEAQRMLQEARAAAGAAVAAAPHHSPPAVRADRQPQPEHVSVATSPMSRWPEVEHGAAVCPSTRPPPLAQPSPHQQQHQDQHLQQQHCGPRQPGHLAGPTDLHQRGSPTAAAAAAARDLTAERDKYAHKYQEAKRACREARQMARHWQSAYWGLLAEHEGPEAVQAAQRGAVAAAPLAGFVDGDQFPEPAPAAHVAPPEAYGAVGQRQAACLLSDGAGCPDRGNGCAGGSVNEEPEALAPGDEATGPQLHASSAAVAGVAAWLPGPLPVHLRAESVGPRGVEDESGGRERKGGGWRAPRGHSGQDTSVVVEPQLGPAGGWHGSDPPHRRLNQQLPSSSDCVRPIQQEMQARAADDCAGRGGQGETSLPRDSADREVNSGGGTGAHGRPWQAAPPAAATAVTSGRTAGTADAVVRWRDGGVDADVAGDDDVDMTQEPSEGEVAAVQGPAAHVEQRHQQHRERLGGWGDGSCGREPVIAEDPGDEAPMGGEEYGGRPGSAGPGKGRSGDQSGLRRGGHGGGGDEGEDGGGGREGGDGWLNRRSRSRERGGDSDRGSAGGEGGSRRGCGGGVVDGRQGTGGGAVGPRGDRPAQQAVGQLQIERRLVQQRLPFGKRQRPPLPSAGACAEQPKRQRLQPSQSWRADQAPTQAPAGGLTGQRGAMVPYDCPPDALTGAAPPTAQGAGYSRVDLSCVDAGDEAEVSGGPQGGGLLPAEAPPLKRKALGPPPGRTPGVGQGPAGGGGGELQSRRRAAIGASDRSAAEAVGRAPTATAQQQQRTANPSAACGPQVSAPAPAPGFAGRLAGARGTGGSGSAAGSGGAEAAATAAATPCLQAAGPGPGGGAGGVPRAGGGRDEPGYKYTAVVRGRAEREALQAVECAGCRAFYEAVATWGDVVVPTCNHQLADRRGAAATAAGGRAAAGSGQGGAAEAPAEAPAAQPNREGRGLSSALRQAGGRHRFKFAPPATPEGFWDIGFGDTQD